MALAPKPYSPQQQMQRPDYELQYKRDFGLTEVELHHHDFYELYYLVSGDVVYTIESKCYRVLPGDVLLISPRELHQVHIQPERSAYERYVLWISPQMVERLSSEQSRLLRALDPSTPGYTNQLRLQPADQQRIRDRMERLYWETQEAAFGADLLPRCLLTELLVTVNRLALREDCRLEGLSSSSRTVTQVVDYINLNFAQPLTLDFLADTFFISKYHLSHEFQRQVGTSVGRYLQKKRLQTARHLMSQGMRPGQACLLCGFSDYTGFYRAFKAEYGTSPRAFLSGQKTGTP